MQPFSQSQIEFLGRLLEVIIRKMKYDDETEWGDEEEEPEEEALFAELRKVVTLHDSWNSPTDNISKYRI